MGEAISFFLITIVAIGVAIFSYKLHRNSHKISKDAEKQYEAIDLAFYKDKGTHFRKPVDECFIIEEKTKEAVENVEYKDFIDYMNRLGSRYETVFVDMRKTRISCYVNFFGKERLISQIVDYDHTVVEIKVRMQGYIDVYIMEETDYEGEKIHSWYMDISFLDKPIFE
ncbi:MAG: hypothetical protein Q4C98_07090 [Capnocytophaga sp.]|nr:hypothetical protein [Capnocytophaga sp.]